MNIQNMRFRPLYAADGDGGSPDAGAEVTAIVNEGEPEGDVIEIEGLDGETTAEGGDEFEDIDLGDFKVKAPKGKANEVRDGILRLQDYTKKTQTVAEREKAADAAKATYEEKLKFDDTFREGTVHLKMMDNDLQNRLKYLNGPEYRTLDAENPLEAQRLLNQYQLNKDRRTDLASALGRMQSEANSKAADEAKAQTEAESKRREQLPREIGKLVPGWNADRAAKVKEFAVSIGYAPEAIDNTTDALHYKTLDLARIGQLYLDARARSGKGAVTPNAQAVGKTKMVGQGGGNPSSGPNDRMTTEQWMAAERKRVADQGNQRKAK